MEETQVTGEADVAKLERLATKRDFIIATPGHSPVLEPPLSKARNEEPLPAVPPFPKPSENNSSSTGNDPVLAALTKLTAEIANMRLEGATKADVAKMASKDDLIGLQSSILSQTQGLIQDAVDPLKSDICDMKSRVSKIEAAAAHGTSSSHPSSSSLSPNIKQLIDGLDPAHRRISLSGFPEKMTARERSGHIDKFFFSIPGFSHVVTTGIIFKRPKNDRKPTKFSFVEFSTTDTVREALTLVKNTNVSVDGATITIKNALTKIDGVRNYSLREAEKMAKDRVSTGKDTITMDWKTRCVNHGTTAIFS